MQVEKLNRERLRFRIYDYGTHGYRKEALQNITAFGSQGTSAVSLDVMPDFDIETINIIKQAITSAEISEEQIDKSVSKILDLKYDLLEEENIYTKEYLGSISHQEIISKITS